MTDCTGQGDSDGAELEGAVLGYLHRHPRAADTLDGIVNWWLPQQRYEMARARIERALARLVEDGVLRRERLPDGGILYALSAHGPTASIPH